MSTCTQGFPDDGLIYLTMGHHVREQVHFNSSQMQERRLLYTFPSLHAGTISVANVGGPSLRPGHGVVILGCYEFFTTPTLAAWIVSAVFQPGQIVKVVGELPFAVAHAGRLTLMTLPFNVNPF